MLNLGGCEGVASPLNAAPSGADFLQPQRGQGPIVFGSLLVDPQSRTPYSDATSSKKVTSRDRVKRPMNGFMVWSQIRRRDISERHPQMHNAEISRQLGNRWQELSEDDRLPFMQEAERLRDLHAKEYPGYKYQPRQRRNKARAHGGTTSASASAIGTRGQNRRGGVGSDGVHHAPRKPQKQTKREQKTGEWEVGIQPASSQPDQDNGMVRAALAPNGCFIYGREMSQATSGDATMTSSPEASGTVPGPQQAIEYPYPGWTTSGDDDDDVFLAQHHHSSWASLTPAPQCQGHWQGQGQGQDQLPSDLSNLFEDGRDFSSALFADLSGYNIQQDISSGFQVQPPFSSETFQASSLNPAAPIQMENVHQYPENRSVATIDYHCYSDDSWPPPSCISQPEVIESQEPFYDYQHYEPIFKSI